MYQMPLFSSPKAGIQSTDHDGWGIHVRVVVYITYEGWLAWCQVAPPEMPISQIPRLRERPKEENGIIVQVPVPAPGC